MIEVTIKEHLTGHKNHYYVLTVYRNDVKIAVHTSKSLNYINKLNKQYKAKNNFEYMLNYRNV